MKLAFVIDSSTELSPELKTREDIFVVQDYVNYTELETNPISKKKKIKFTSVRDNEHDNIEDLLAKMSEALREGLPLPKTSQPLPKDFTDTFNKILEADYTHVIALLLPKIKSGTWQSAMIAKELVPGLDYFIPELRTISVATTLVLEEAIIAYVEGSDIAELKKIIRDTNKRVEAYLTLERLEYAVAGGRITRLEGWLGSLLNIKPIITLDETGDLIPIERVRTMGKTVDRLAELISDKITIGRKNIIYAGESMKGYAETLKDKLNNSYILKASSGALVANGGPLLAVAGLPEY